MTTKNANLNETLQLINEWALKAGVLLIKKQKQISTLKIKDKKSQGVASQVDIDAEKIIVDGIKKHFPTHFVLAEEGAYDEFKGENARYEFLKDKEWVWIIDPLDGTNNYLAGLDYFGICIALVHYGVPQVSLVLRPQNGDCFYAIKNKGAFYKKYSDNLKTVSRAKKLTYKPTTKKLKESLLVTGFVTEKGDYFEQEFNFFKFMMTKSRGIRRMGSAALDMCYVASGNFDCFWERGLSPWDVAASGLIVQEVGLEVTDYDGQKFHPFQETIVCARKSIHKEMLSLFQLRL